MPSLKKDPVAEGLRDLVRSVVADLIREMLRQLTSPPPAKPEPQPQPERKRKRRYLLTKEMASAPLPAAEIKSIRKKLQMTREAFAGGINVSTGTLVLWETGRRACRRRKYIDAIRAAERHHDMKVAAAAKA